MRTTWQTCVPNGRQILPAWQLVPKLRLALSLSANQAQAQCMPQNVHMLHCHFDTTTKERRNNKSGLVGDVQLVGEELVLEQRGEEETLLVPASRPAAVRVPNHE